MAVIQRSVKLWWLDSLKLNSTLQKWKSLDFLSTELFFWMIKPKRNPAVKSKKECKTNLNSLLIGKKRMQSHKKFLQISKNLLAKRELSKLIVLAKKKKFSLKLEQKLIHSLLKLIQKILSLAGLIYRHHKNQ